MAGDWIPRQKGLSKKPEILAIARMTNNHRRWVAETLCEFWDWVDQESPDGCLGVLLEDLPAFIEETDTTFWQAVVSVGWLRVHPDGKITVPNHDRWLGRCAKNRFTQALKKRRQRALSPHEGQKGDASGTPVLSSPVLFDGEDVKDSGERNGKGQSPDTFAAFWKAYPRKVAKEDALRAWKKLSPTTKLADEIIAAVRRQSGWEQWTKDAGTYIPHPATWLNGRRWEDEPPQEARPAAKTADQIAEEARSESEAAAKALEKLKDRHAG